VTLTRPAQETVMSQVHARAAHTLGEILLDNRTTEEKVKGAAKSAPFWVIAIMGHLVLVFVFGMIVLRQETARQTEDKLVSEIRQPVEDAKIEEAPEIPSEVVRSAMPFADAKEVAMEVPDFINAIDEVVVPEAIESGKHGVSEGDDSATDIVSMSFGGKGKAGSIGIGGGSAPGGGSARGRPGAGNRRDRINIQTSTLKPTEPVVKGGLEWLARHQSPDGSWDCDGFNANCDHKRGAACAGRGSAVFDAGVTGLALLAFLGAGHDSQFQGPYLETVRNGLKYLKNIQDAEGCFGSRSDVRHTYSQACATLAMCEAYAATRQLPWRKAAEAGVAYINACRNPYKGWRYGKAPGDNDASVTGWMLMALKGAKDAGIPVDDSVMKDGLAVIDALTDEDTGRTGYVKKGELPVRPEGLSAKWPATETESLTAVAMTARIFCDQTNSPLMKAGAELLAKKLPLWDEARGSIDMYYWYYGTLAMFQMGGDNWDRWNKNLKTVVVDHQHHGDSCLEGSWDPVDPWGEEGGRVYSTALMTLCLEVYYRYPRVFGTKKG
jgi:hypothetical protein